MGGIYQGIKEKATGNYRVRPALAGPQACFSWCPWKWGIPGVDARLSQPSFLSGYFL
jgi:hypothetical protein